MSEIADLFLEQETELEAVRQALAASSDVVQLQARKIGDLAAQVSKLHDGIEAQQGYIAKLQVALETRKEAAQLEKRILQERATHLAQQLSHQATVASHGGYQRTDRRRIKKTVVRDSQHRIEAVIEEPLTD